MDDSRNYNKYYSESCQARQLIRDRHDAEEDYYEWNFFNWEDVESIPAIRFARNDNPDIPSTSRDKDKQNTPVSQGEYLWEIDDADMACFAGSDIPSTSKGQDVETDEDVDSVLQDDCETVEDQESQSKNQEDYSECDSFDWEDVESIPAIRFARNIDADIPSTSRDDVGPTEDSVDDTTLEKNISVPRKGRKNASAGRKRRYTRRGGTSLGRVAKKACVTKKKKACVTKKKKGTNISLKKQREIEELIARWKDVTAYDLGPTAYEFKPKRVPGPQNLEDLDSGASELQYFRKMFTEAIMSELADEINSYAEETIKKRKLKPSSRLHQWTATDPKELDALFAIFLNMGIIRLPRICDYWSLERTVKQPYFRKVMSRNRFMLLFQTMLHVSHVDSDIAAIAKRGKIQPILNKMVSNFQKQFQPYKEISADETMIAFKGQIAFRQYMPNKPSKFGLLARTLADAATGYILNVDLYFGKSDEQTSNLSKTAYAVVKICEPYFHQGYHVFADRLYNSLELANKLYEKETHLTGTIRKNRKGLPPQLKDKTLDKTLGAGGLISFRDGNNLILHWMDKRSTTLISNCYKGDKKVKVVHRRTKKSQIKPHAIMEYNKFMGGVHLADQLNQYYKFSTPTVKWWKKVFFWLLDTAVTNSYILYKLDNKATIPKHYGHLQFRRNLIASLCPFHDDEPEPPAKRRCTDIDSQRLSNTFHALKKRSKRRQCKVCSNRNIPGGRHETFFYCATCDDEPTLCPTDCFRKYHTLINYKCA